MEFQELFPKAKYSQLVDAIKITIVSQSLKTPRKVVPILWGAPGVGKSSLIEEVAERLGMRCKTIIASVHEAVDFGGFPMVRKEEGYVDYLPPKWLFEIVNSQHPIVLFLDEIDKSPTSVQNALLRLLLSRELNGLEVPSHVAFVMAANPPGLGGDWLLSAPLSNRLVHFFVSCDSDEIAAWFENVGVGKDTGEVVAVDEEVFQRRYAHYRKLIAAFLRKSPQYTVKIPDNPILQSTPFPSPRSWEFVSILLAAADAMGVRSEVVKRLLVWGCVGEVGDVFLSFLQENEVPSPEEIIQNPHILKELTPDKVYHAIVALTDFASQSKDNFKVVVSIIPIIDEIVGSDVALQVTRGLKRVVEKSKDDELRDMLIDVIGRTRLVEIWSASR